MTNSRLGTPVRGNHVARANEGTPEGFKGCSVCNKVKPLTEFPKNGIRNGEQYYYSHCNECRKPIAKAKYKEETREYKLYYRAKARASTLGREFTIEKSDIVIPKVCPILKVPFEEEGDYVPSLDRIDSNGGYTLDNIQVVSRRANILKNNGTLDEFKLIVKHLECAQLSKGN